MKVRIFYGAMVALLGIQAMADVNQYNKDGQNMVTYTNCKFIYMMEGGPVCTDHPLPNLMQKIRSSSTATPQPLPQPQYVAPSQPTSTASTFYDASTGLQWQDNSYAKTVKKDWEGAKSYCANLTLDGYSDWRLPSYPELLTIVDYTKYKPAIKTGFKNTATDGWYWSASPSVSYDSYAWVVDFCFGFTVNYTKTRTGYVRCVRGRQ